MFVRVCSHPYSPQSTPFILSTPRGAFDVDPQGDSDMSRRSRTSGAKMAQQHRSRPPLPKNVVSLCRFSVSSSWCAGICVIISSTFFFFIFYLQSKLAWWKCPGFSVCGWEGSCKVGGDEAATSPRHIFSHKQILFLPMTLPPSLGKSPSGEWGEILFSLALASPAVCPPAVHLCPPHPFLPHNNNHICCNQSFRPPPQPFFVWVHSVHVLLPPVVFLMLPNHGHLSCPPL